MKTKSILICLLLLVAFISGTRAQTDAPATGGAAAPPSAPPQLSEAELEKLVAPIALYPDPLLATLLPASAYPLDIVKAARFIANTNNIPKIDSQPWDPNVKALARFPEVIQKMNDDLDWTSSLGDAFANNQKSVMNAIQVMRGKAEDAGTLKTTPQQTVTVTNTVVKETVNQQVTLVTNTVVQIVPSSPDVIYVPTYSPAVVYAAPAPGAVAAASFMSFGMGMMWGAAINNNCDWHHGDIDVNHNINRDVNRNVNRTVNGNNRNVNNVNVNNRNVNANNRSTGAARQNTSANGANRNARQNTAANTGGQQKWQPDPSRREASPRTSSASSGWSGGNASAQRDAFNNSGGAAQARDASQRGTTSRSGGQYGGGQRSTGQYGGGQRSTGQYGGGQRTGGQRSFGGGGGGARRSGGGGRGRR